MPIAKGEETKEKRSTFGAQGRGRKWRETLRPLRSQLTSKYKPGTFAYQPWVWPTPHDVCDPTVSGPFLRHCLRGKGWILLVSDCYRSEGGVYVWKGSHQLLSSSFTFPFLSIYVLCISLPLFLSLSNAIVIDATDRRWYVSGRISFFRVPFSLSLSLSLYLPHLFFRHSTGAHALSAPVATPLFAPSHITSLRYNMTRTLTCLVNTTMSYVAIHVLDIGFFLFLRNTMYLQGYLLPPPISSSGVMYYDRNILWRMEYD